MRNTLTAKALRKHLTDAEKIIWQIVRNKNFKGLKFRRQEPIGKYIVDFVCFEKKVIIELDGGQHSETIIHDKKRTLWLENEGFKVIRFWNNEVLNSTDSVKQVIWDKLG